MQRYVEIPGYRVISSQAQEIERSIQSGDPFRSDITDRLCRLFT